MLHLQQLQKIHRNINNEVDLSNNVYLLPIHVSIIICVGLWY